MRIYLSLIITAILLSFSTAYFALNLQRDHFATLEEVKEIKRLEKDFQRVTPFLIELDLSSMYPTRDYFQLMQPIVHPFSQASKFSKECGKPSDRMTRTPTNKVEAWEAFRCQEIVVLPANFFEFSPFIHESGVSYAYLAFSSGLEPFNDVSWVKKHLNFFHISELRLLPPEGLDERFKILSALEDSHYNGVITGDASLLTEEYYLAKKEQRMGHLYRVFSRMDLEKYLNKKAYDVKPMERGTKCYFADGSICWQRDSSNLLQMLRPSSIIIFVASILILILVALSLYSRIKLQNREEERKKHALRVLTHELRTPIANLLLQIEGINKQSDLVAPAILEELLKIEGEVYRLKRLAEKSSSYLNSNNEKGLITFEYKEVPSANDLIGRILEDYKNQNIVFLPLASDQSVVLDIYWFSICLKNLIENAINHGAKPISVTTLIDGSFLRIDVVDQGKYSTERKDAQSSGLGMGLSIVGKIMTEMKGKLVAAHSPTTFSLYIRSKE